MYKFVFILLFLYSNALKKINLPNSGYDERFNIKQRKINNINDINDINQIASNMNKYNLVKKLKDPELSSIKKMELLESYFKINTVKPASLIGGKLFDEFLNN